jgi:hypothetical protein
MNSKAPVALAIGVGYLLGRTHRLRWALILGTAAATGRLNGVPTQALERGMSALRSTPELAKLTDNASRLLDAGRSAAISAMNSRVESMGGMLEDRAGQAGGAAKFVAGSASGAASAVRPGGRGASDEDEERPRERDRAKNGEQDEYDEDEPDDYDERDEYDDRDENDDYEDEADEPDEDEPEEDDEPVSAGPRRGGGQPGRRQVVRKTGR